VRSLTIAVWEKLGRTAAIVAGDVVLIGEQGTTLANRRAARLAWSRARRLLKRLARPFARVTDSAST
jgi:hypothetical protein